MSRKMLIDAAHQEELRVVITNNGIVEEFDYQNNLKKSTKANIYLAKVTRVEPSLQAAFVDYGGNRHGFLPFSEIHPDYYQLPSSDKEKLLEEILTTRKEQEAKAEAREQERKAKLEAEKKDEAERANSDDEASEEAATPNRRRHSGQDSENDEDSEKPQFYKRYKIQEVIKKDQVILVQVEKEERGNKGAALTSYISLAGRYCVLMPNATKGGGVSRKIGDEQDRDRLKKVAREISESLPGNGAIIIRTAGAFKTKTEINRDCTYLANLWNNIRENTIKSNAPTFIHEEGDVLKKSIRDLYDNSIDQILIEGETSFNEAQEFMKLILPKHVGKIILYNERAPLFSKHSIEEQIAALYSSQASLKSGGYIVINQTEALVAIDVNSGRATSERNVESTAVKTNIEAAHEIARQIRLRDLSGLVVIDFIDMLETRNKRSVEKALKDALSHDKAKIQMGRISPFGLLEMSRQRIRQSIAEANTEVCNHCLGRGRVRTPESSAIIVLRAIESEMSTTHADEVLNVSASSNLVFNIMNKKRKELAALESKYPERIIFSIDETAGGDGFFFEKKRMQREVADVRALSSIDKPSSEESSEASTESGSHSNNRKFGKTRFKKPLRNNNRPPYGRNSQSEGFQPQQAVLADDSVEPNQPTSHEETKVDSQDKRRHHRNKPRPPRRDRSDFAPQQSAPRTSHSPSDDIDVQNFDQEMAERRKNNQSLLKEIWKKIVD